VRVVAQPRPVVPVVHPLLRRPFAVRMLRPHLAFPPMTLCLYTDSTHSRKTSRVISLFA
jgi:hypothetical protein